MWENQTHANLGNRLKLLPWDSAAPEWNTYSGTPLHGHPDITDSFVCPDEKLIHMYIFSKINPLNKDTGEWTLFCVPSDKLSYIVNPALRTVFI